MPSRPHHQGHRHQPPAQAHSLLPELLVIHQALEGWIIRQHVITRGLVLEESAKLRKEIRALRKEIRAYARKRSRVT